MLQEDAPLPKAFTAGSCGPLEFPLVCQDRDFGFQFCALLTACCIRRTAHRIVLPISGTGTNFMLIASDHIFFDMLSTGEFPVGSYESCESSDGSWRHCVIHCV